MGKTVLMRITTALLMLLVCVLLNAQNGEKSLQQFFREGGIRPTKVMLVGTFHFAYQNLDMHKTAKKNQRNILSQKSQAEL
jgi:hypothetical protein